ncbi:MAG TPA: AMP-binding protein [Candidatus Sulfotelmatobacter sp.]|nr:AMP-binding protein [Candidatus Sulfotelmatobacter sp.]
MDLATSFRDAVEREPDAPALVDGTLRLTYAQWLARIASVATGLRALGVGEGDRVLAVLRNGEPLCTLYWACALLGAAITPVNWRLADGELAYIVGDAEPRCAVVEDVGPQIARVAHAVPTVGVGTVVGAATSWAALVRTPPATLPPVAETATAILLYTSGTTGRPKGVPRTHRAERAAALAHVAQNRYRRGEVTLGSMPLYHTMGVRSLVAMALTNGTFVSMPKFDAAGALDLIECERITNLYLAPTLYYDLVHVPGIEARDLRSLTKLGYAGAPMTPSLVERCFALFAPEIFVNHYGSTEIYTFTIYDQLDRKPACAGKAGLNECVRVVRLGSDDPDDVCVPGESGQIIARLDSEEAFAGYWRRPDADAKAIRSGWYFNGDLGMKDDDGDLFVLGRVDDMIITGGENVYPAEVEDVIAAHPAVGRCAIIGVRDERLGEKIVAFVEPLAAVSAAELDAYARGSGMTQFKRPREYVFVAAIPQSASGKVLRTELRAGNYTTLPQEIPS